MEFLELVALADEAQKLARDIAAGHDHVVRVYRKGAEERDAWRACAEQIAPFARFLRGELEKEGVDFEVQKQIIAALAEFDRLKKEAP